MTTTTNTIDDLIARANKAIENAKTLTTKQRDDMKESTFCGPNRSFPVPDCKHVAVAKAYLGKSKFSKSAKEKIAACINKKAKKLGCNTETKAKAGREFPIYIELSYDQKQLYTSAEFKTTKELVDASLKHPNMDLTFVDFYV